MKNSKYKDVFTLSQSDAEKRNEQLLTDALDAIYSTYILNELVASHRGKAIQHINSMARMLGYPKVIRND